MGVLLFGRVILIGRIAFRLIVRGRLRSLILGGDWEVELVMGGDEGFLESGGVDRGRGFAEGCLVSTRIVLLRFQYLPGIETIS